MRVIRGAEPRGAVGRVKPGGYRSRSRTRRRVRLQRMRAVHRRGAGRRVRRARDERTCSSGALAGATWSGAPRRPPDAGRPAARDQRTASGSRGAARECALITASRGRTARRSPLTPVAAVARRKALPPQTDSRSLVP